MAYVLTYVASVPNLGGSGVAVMSQSALQSVIGKLNDSGFINQLKIL